MSLKVLPGRSDGTITEILAWYLFHELVVKADAHIDLRGGDVAESHLVHSIHPVSGDERVNRVSEEMSRACGYDYYQPRLPRERSLVYEASFAGVPSIITQSGLGYKTQPNDVSIQLHISAVTNVMKHFNMISRVRFSKISKNPVRVRITGLTGKRLIQQRFCCIKFAKKSVIGCKIDKKWNVFRLLFYRPFNPFAGFFLITQLAMNTADQIHNCRVSVMVFDCLQERIVSTPWLAGANKEFC